MMNHDIRINFKNTLLCTGVVVCKFVLAFFSIDIGELG
uniref:Uncharacterized protein n=1 Tax=Lepeophtheirus salmonis TaxID=72036 RepID=A0A0K2UX52_LEPSM